MGKLVRIGERLDLGALLQLQVADCMVAEHAPHISEEHLLLDLAELRFMEPCGIVGLVEILEREGRPVAIRRPRSQDAFQYGQRIKLFQKFNLFLDIAFREHAPGSRFTELTPICAPMGARSPDQEQLCEQLAQVVCPENEDRDLISFCLGEIISNVLQHSGSSGVVCAQHYPGLRKVEFAIADHGIGLREALGHNPDYFLDSDAEAIRLAVEPNTSGTFHAGNHPYGNRQNSGNGLFFLDQIVRLSHGFLDIWSGSAHYARDGNHAPTVRTVTGFPGTLIRCRVSRGIAPRLEELIEEIRRDLVPCSDAVGRIEFE